VEKDMDVSFDPIVIGEGLTVPPFIFKFQGGLAN